MQFVTLIVILQLLHFGQGINIPDVSARAYANPFNRKSIDLFMLVDETQPYLSQLKHLQVKSVVIDIAQKMNVTGSIPYFGVFFYGATTSVRQASNFPTTSASAVKTNLERLQYTSVQTNPSNLLTALNEVEIYCKSYCRADVPRVVLVIAGSLDQSFETKIRSLEQSLQMTVIIIGMENRISTQLLDNLATPPTNLFAIPLGSIGELISATGYLELVLSEVPRHVQPNSIFDAVNVVAGEYYTLQLNIAASTQYGEYLIAFTTTCFDCRVFASLQETTPTLANSLQQWYMHAAYGVANTYVYYFRVPRDARRFYLSFRPNYSTTRISNQINVFAVPAALVDVQKPN